MTRSVVQIRVDEETLVVWRAAAKEDRVSLSDFVRAAVDLRLAATGVATSPPAPARASRSRARRAEATPCRNRQRHVKGVRCAYCGATP